MTNVSNRAYESSKSTAVTESGPDATPLVTNGSALSISSVELGVGKVELELRIYP